MLFSFFHFLTGYCQVALSGANQARFLNLCAAQKILLWKVSKRENHYIFYISAGGYKELDKLAAKTGVSYRCISKKGLPYLFYRYKKRKILLLGVLASAACFYILSLFIWRVQTEGCYSHSDEEIMDYLKQKGIHAGTRLSYVSCPELEEQIRKDYKDIAWVSCEKKGTLLKVEVKETLDVREENQEEEETPCNLIAARDGTIDSILVRSGSAKVKAGDKVKTGDVLISGVVEIYDDAGEVAEETLVRAQGDIYAVSQISYEDSFSLLYYKKEYSGRTRKAYKIAVGDYLVKLPGGGHNFSDFDEESREIAFHIGAQFYLPLSVYVTTFMECDAVAKTYTKTEAAREAKRRLSLFLQEYETKGVVILKNNVKINSDENQCTAKGSLTVKERVGKIQEISRGQEEEQAR